MYDKLLDKIILGLPIVIISTIVMYVMYAKLLTEIENRRLGK